jgi:hypothetical protein
MAALKVVLEYTKPKPGNAIRSLAERRAIRAEGPEGECRPVLVDAPPTGPADQQYTP